MIYFNGIPEKDYFEGWFFRVCAEGFNCALIPSVSVANGEKRAFIQVNCNDFSKRYEFDFAEFSADDHAVTIGGNRFSTEGIQFESGEMTIDAQFGTFRPLESDIMGCFKFGTPCKHRIISMKHTVTLRKAVLRGKQLPIQNALGYAEKDWGGSFPKTYCWLQCNDFEDGESSFFCSVADIGFPFRGLICSLIYGGKEYRFATYNFAKIVALRHGEIELKRSKYRLLIRFSEGTSNALLAPKRGKMSRTIKEDLCGTLQFSLYEKDKLLHSGSGKNAGIEWVF